jgi:hypothetical protein
MASIFYSRGHEKCISHKDGIDKVHEMSALKIFLWKKKFQAEIKMTPTSCYKGSQSC